MDRLCCKINPYCACRRCDVLWCLQCYEAQGLNFIRESHYTTPYHWKNDKRIASEGLLAFKGWERSMITSRKEMCLRNNV